MAGCVLGTSVYVIGCLKENQQGSRSRSGIVLALNHDDFCLKGRIVQPPKTGLKCTSAAAPTLQQTVACTILLFKHPMTYICSQHTTSHNAQKLIYHCVLTVWPALTEIPL